MIAGFDQLAAVTGCVVGAGVAAGCSDGPPASELALAEAGLLDGDARAIPLADDEAPAATTAGFAADPSVSQPIPAPSATTTAARVPRTRGDRSGSGRRAERIGRWGLPTGALYSVTVRCPQRCRSSFSIDV
jgi:hypothetical protein